MTLSIIFAVIMIAHIIGSIFMYRYMKKQFSISTDSLTNTKKSVTAKHETFATLVTQTLERHERFYRRRVNKLCPVCGDFKLKKNKPHVCAGYNPLDLCPKGEVRVS